MRTASLFVLFVLLAACTASAEIVPEQEGVHLLLTKKALWVSPHSVTGPHALVRIHFWVANDGGVEAVEQVCGERELFDEIADPLLNWTFRSRDGGSYSTDITFLRRGRRVWPMLELPPASRRKDCR